jgi:plastocyanin
MLTRTHRLPALRRTGGKRLGATRLLRAAACGFALTAAPGAVRAEVQTFHVLTVHVDGNTNVRGDSAHPAEAFPTQALPEGGGLQLSPPDADGNWRMRAFVFVPSQLVVHVGDEVELHFVGVQGPSHRIRIDGVAEEIDLLRGEIEHVTLRPAKPGVIHFESLKRLPSMRGQILVLPR